MAKLSLQGQGAIVTGSASINPGSISAATVSEVSISDSNAALGDVVCWSAPAAGLTANLAAGGAYVSAAGTIKLRIANPTAGAIVQGSIVVNYCLIRA